MFNFVEQMHTTQRNPDAVRAAKQVLNDSEFVSVRDGLAQEALAARELLGTRDQIESVRAGFEKRPPLFSTESS